MLNVLSVAAVEEDKLRISIANLLIQELEQIPLHQTTPFIKFSLEITNSLAKKPALVL